MCSHKRNYAASVPISTFMCLWVIYIFPGLINIFSCNRIGRPIMGIYKSLTDTWMWNSGLRPRNSFSGNIFSKFSVLCLCSVGCLSFCFSIPNVIPLQLVPATVFCLVYLKFTSVYLIRSQLWNLSYTHYRYYFRGPYVYCSCIYRKVFIRRR